ncbi:hypothetical protein HZ994_05075 [Akkermansiaceae bacterium]|nr:hypothetical protein HZ994_05075 [Akkermansiaceae bacterium]
MMRHLSILLLGSCLASANSEPPLPDWNSEERRKAIGGGWVAGGSLLTYEAFPPEEEEAETPLDVEGPTAEELAGFPEDENEVSEEFLAAYFAERPEGHLVDPQNLLSTRESQDLEAFLARHSGDSSIEMYVYLFGMDQQIPGDVREEEVVERLYSVGKPALVVYYHLGAPQRATVYLSPVITDSVSAAEQRRALESSVMQAFGSAQPFEQLEAFLVQMSIRIYWMERMASGMADETMEEMPGDVVAVPAGNEQPRPKRFEVPAWGRLALWSAAAAGGGLLALWSLVMWWRSRVRFRFPEFEVEPRLGGSHAAGIGAVISFASPSLPPAKQRNQVPDYMRRA